MAAPLAWIIAFVAAVLGAALIVRWLIGLPSRAMPRCRACRSDARGRAAAMPCACLGCGQALQSPRGVIASGRVRRSRHLIAAGALLVGASSLVALDRGAARTATRWDAWVIPASWDLERLKSAPSDAAGAIDRLWLRTITGRLTPAEASQAVDLVGRSTALQNTEGAHGLLSVAALRADTIVDEARAVDLIGVTRSLVLPEGSVRPGGRVTLDTFGVIGSSPWGALTILRSIKVGGVACAIDRVHSVGVPIAEGWLTTDGYDTSIRLPESLPEGDFSIDLEAEHVLVPIATHGRLFGEALASPDRSLERVPIKQLRRPFTRSGPLTIARSGPELLEAKAAQIFASMDWSPQLPKRAFLAEHWSNSVAVSAAAAVVVLCGLALLAWIGFLRLLRGIPHLVPPSCMGCGSHFPPDMRPDAVSDCCRECGHSTTLPESIAWLTYRWSTPRTLVSVAALLVALTSATFVVAAAATLGWLTYASIAGPLQSPLQQFERALAAVAQEVFADSATSKGSIRPPTRRSLRALAEAQDLMADAIYSDDELSPHLSEEHLRSTKIAMAQFVERLPPELPSSPIIDELLMTLGEAICNLASAADEDAPAEWLRDEAHLWERLTPVRFLRPLRHRAGGWSKIEGAYEWDLPMSVRVVSITGVESRPAKTESDETDDWSWEIRTPDVPPGTTQAIPVRFTESFRLCSEPSVKRQRTHDAIIEVVPAGTSLASATTDPADSPFWRPPTMFLHQIDAGPRGERWLVDLHTAWWEGSRSEAEGEWAVLDAHGNPVARDGDTLTAAEMQSIQHGCTVHFVPTPLDDLDPEIPVVIWGREERWLITPKVRPLGWWDGRFWWEQFEEDDA